MAVTKKVTPVEITVLSDGQVRIKEKTSFIDGGQVASERHDYRFIDVGDSVASEIQLIKDIVNGNLHNPARLAARELVKNPPPPPEEIQP
jgi:hypothetical protein